MVEIVMIMMMSREVLVVVDPIKSYLLLLLLLSVDVGQDHQATMNDMPMCTEYRDRRG